jgi:hypothetical protein
MEIGEAGLGKRHVNNWFLHRNANRSRQIREAPHSPIPTVISKAFAAILIMAPSMPAG